MLHLFASSKLKKFLKKKWVVGKIGEQLEKEEEKVGERF